MNDNGLAETKANKSGRSILEKRELPRTGVATSFIEIYSVTLKPYLLASIYKKARGKRATKREAWTMIFKQAVFNSATKIKLLHHSCNIAWPHVLNDVTCTRKLNSFVICTTFGQVV